MSTKASIFLLLLLSAGASLAFAGPDQSKKPAAPLPDSSFAPAQTYPAPPPLNAVWDCDSAYKKGDCNRNGKVLIDDVVRLVNAIFLNSDGAYCPPCLADMNCDRLLTSLDAVWFVRYFFTASPVPRNCP